MARKIKDVEFVNGGYFGSGDKSLLTIENAREFFDWKIEKRPVFSADMVEIPGFSEFVRVDKDGGESTLHVANETYSPFQPGDVFNSVVSALDETAKDYSLASAGQYDGGKRIFAQFKTNESFRINGKEYQGLLTMGKGSDYSMPLMFWLTMVCIICKNTFALAVKIGRKEASKGNALSYRQTKKSGERIDTIKEQIKEFFGLHESVRATLDRMSKQPLAVDNARKAFAALIGGEDTGKTKRGETRLNNRVDSYMAAFQNSAGINGGNTREDWLNAVTNVDTHGNVDSKNFDENKQFVSSEFGTSASRKERAFSLAADDSQFEILVASGEQILSGLLSKSVIAPAIPATITENGEKTDFARLIGA